MIAVTNLRHDGLQYSPGYGWDRLQAAATGCNDWLAVGVPVAVADRRSPHPSDGLARASAEGRLLWCCPGADPGHGMDGRPRAPTPVQRQPPWRTPNPCWLPDTRIWSRYPHGRGARTMANHPSALAQLFGGMADLIDHDHTSQTDYAAVTKAAEALAARAKTQRLVAGPLGRPTGPACWRPPTPSRRPVAPGRHRQPHPGPGRAKPSAASRWRSPPHQATPPPRARPTRLGVRPPGRIPPPGPPAPPLDPT
jgi:hypothetical protein